MNRPQTRPPAPSMSPLDRESAVGSRRERCGSPRRGVSARSGKPLRGRKGSRWAALAASALLACGLGLGTVPAAHAGPDDGRHVTTQGHVDSPKTFWKDGRFVLLNEGGGMRPVGETVNWVGKGWSARGKSQYTFTLDGSPSLSHLGKPGEVWYRAPALPQGNQDPIWAGFGADSNIPVEKFRDGSFSLDLMEVKGPGRMEMFNHFPGEHPTDLSMLLSSFREGWQSSLLHPGSHTHNETVFSKPGRYELTYRTVARGTDGKVIASEPSTMVWQVGGQRPLDEQTPSTRQRYDDAHVGSLEEAGYRFSVAPKTERENDADEHLSTLAFEAADRSLEGTLTVMIDGYFLTDLPVREGRAVWDEMLGSSSSDLQAVFTPAGERGARWISPVLTRQPGGSASVDSGKGEGRWPEEHPVPENRVLRTGPYTPVSADYSVDVRTERIGTADYAKVTVAFDDPKVRAFIRGGYYETPDAKGPDAALEGNTEDGKLVTYVTADEWLKGTTVKLKVIPHPEMNLKGFSVDLPDKFSPGYSYTGYGRMARTEGGAAQLDEISAARLSPAPLPDRPTPDGPAPTPGAPVDPLPSPDAPGQPAPSPSHDPEPRRCMAPELAGRSLLDEGHVDLLARLEDNRLRATLKDDTGQITRASAERPLDQVVLGVGRNARQQRTAKLMDPALDFLGKQGETFYGLPMTQQPGKIWPGYNTMGVDYGKLDGPVTLRLAPEKMPDGARFGMYYTDAFGTPEVLLDSTAGKESIAVGYPTHVHANWAFSHPGLYRFRTVYEARTADGRQLSSTPQTLVFAVGKEAIEGCLHGPATPPAPGKPGEPTASHGAPASPGALVSEAPALGSTSVTPEGAAPVSEVAAHPVGGAASEGGATARRGDTEALASAGAAQPKAGDPAPEAGSERPGAGRPEESPVAEAASGGMLARTGATALGPLAALALVGLAVGWALLKRRSSSSS